MPVLAICLCQKADPAYVFNFKWLDSSDNVPFPCADMYRYPKRSIDLLISDDAVMSEVLLAKDRCDNPSSHIAVRSQVLFRSLAVRDCAVRSGCSACAPRACLVT